MASQAPFSIILCGKSRAVGEPVMEYLRPEYSVLTFIDSVERGVREIPALLNEKKDVYAVVLGGGYDDEAYERIRKASMGPERKEVFWVRPDTTKPGPQEYDSPAEYGKAVAARTKTKLDELKNGDTAEGELVFF